MQLYQVFISAENKEQATTILDGLLEAKLILGGPILEGPAKFWWKNEIISMGYCYILTYTTEKLKQAVIKKSKELSKEEAPMLSFIPIDANIELAQLIENTLSK